MPSRSNTVRVQCGTAFVLLCFMATVGFCFATSPHPVACALAAAATAGVGFWAIAVASGPMVWYAALTLLTCMLVWSASWGVIADVRLVLVSAVCLATSALVRALVQLTGVDHETAGNVPPPRLLAEPVEQPSPKAPSGPPPASTESSRSGGSPDQPARPAMVPEAATQMRPPSPRPRRRRVAPIQTGASPIEALLAELEARQPPPQAVADAQRDGEALVAAVEHYAEPLPVRVRIVDTALGALQTAHVWHVPGV